MKKFLTTFIKYPFYANLVVVIIVVAGIIGFFGLKKILFP